MSLVGADPHSRGTALEELPGKVHYFQGNDPAKWRSDIATYAKVKYQGVYPGVDLVYYGNQRQLEYDFIVAPKADPRPIIMEFLNVDQADIDAQGDLLLQAEGRPALRLQKPYIYQDIGGTRREISGGYQLASKHRVGFQIGSYDTTRPLVIDPVLVYSTHFGGSKGDAGQGITLDAAGNVYVTGDTDSPDYPVGKPLQRASGGHADAFVAKLSRDGSEILFSTYIGGGGGDSGYAIAVDTAGDIYITGDTRSADFPVLKPAQRVSGGSSDVFVAKLSGDGSKLLYSTLVGGSGGERGQGIGVDAAGNAYVAGYTNSTNFPTVKPLQAAFAGGNADAFAFKLNGSGSALIYSTYLGGGNDRPELATGIAVDPAGNAYVTGFTNAPDYPTAKPLQPFVGPTDVFVTKINPSGSALLYSTHLGGRADDEGMAIAVDAAGSAYVTGHTESIDFPTTAGAFRKDCVAVAVTIPVVGGSICSGGDAFVSKLSPDGSKLVYSTYLNGRDFEVGRGIAVDSAGSAYVTGFTNSPDFPTADPLQGSFGGGAYDAFGVKLNPGGSALTYSTYLGGSGEDGGYGIAVDAAGKAHVTGYTGSPNFPSKKPSASPARGTRDVFVATIVDKATAK